MIVEHRSVKRVAEHGYLFIVATYVDSAGERTYMAYQEGDMAVGIGDSPYDAIRELCHNLDEADDGDSAGEAT